MTPQGDGGQVAAELDGSGHKQWGGKGKPSIWAPCVPSAARQTAEVSGSDALGKKLHEPKTPNPGALLGVGAVNP